MKEITKLVNEWDTYENLNSEATVEDFYRFQLLKMTQIDEKKIQLGGTIPPHLNGILGKLIGRLFAINAFYFKTLNNENKDIDLVSFGLLNTIYSRKEAKKSDVINDNFLELSTGIDILARLISKGYISERTDPDDKRAKLVKINPEGEKVLNLCKQKLGKIAEFLYGELSIEEKEFIFQLLIGIESKHSELITCKRFKDINEYILECPTKLESKTE